MKNVFQVLCFFFVTTFLAGACSERRSEQAQGRETELAGDEPDETRIMGENETIEYEPSDTVIDVSREEVPLFLRQHAQVLIAAYLDMGEALVQDNAEVAKIKANQLVDMLKRNEQENLELSPEVKEFYTEAAFMIRQSAQNILSANEMWEIRSSFAAMAPAAYKMARIADLSDDALYYRYCSSSFDGRGAYWLSRQEEIRNPYAGGEENENCGKTVAMINYP